VITPQIVISRFSFRSRAGGDKGATAPSLSRCCFSSVLNRRDHLLPLDCGARRQKQKQRKKQREFDGRQS